MLQASIEALVKQQTGIDAKIVGSGLIRSAAERCMRQRQITALSAYWQLLQQDPQVVQELVETVVVPETWFFRDRSPFRFLVTHVQGLIKGQQSRPSAPLKILSVPCSTGEEPYSIAMALLQAGMPTTQFQIDAIDISPKNIRRALVGIYSPFSFRNDDGALKATFFTPAGNQYQLQDRVKCLVKFRVGNILQPLTGGISGSYDIIFCRNLLIYFDHDTRQKVISRLNQLLKPTGMLFVGHAESSLLLNAGWQGVRIPFTFAYQKSAQPGHKLLERASAQALVKSIAKVQQTASITAAAPLLVPTLAPVLPLIDGLEQARQMADRGEFPLAQQICAQQLQRTPLQPDWHLLLGQIHQAQAQPDLAETAFSKALYLQPDCLEALVHLARLKQNRGDREGADLLYARIDRLPPQVRPGINV